jgi:hypothetical protein
MRVRIEADPSSTAIEPCVRMRDGLRVVAGTNVVLLRFEHKNRHPWEFD